MPVTSFPSSAHAEQSPALPVLCQADAAAAASSAGHVAASTTRRAACPIIALVLVVSAAAWSLPSPAQAAEPQPSFTERVKGNVREGAQAVGDYSSDALITTKVKAAFVANGDIKAMDVNVKTRNGVVRLEGAVDTPEQRATAQRLAGDVEGVTSVDNRLTQRTR